MKKLIFLLLAATIFMAAPTTVKAQNGAVPFTISSITHSDTLWNTDTVYAYFNTSGATGGIQGKFEDLGYCWYIDRISDTASAIVTLEVTDNLSHRWQTLTGYSPVTITNIAQNQGTYSVGAINHKYVRLKFISGNVGKSKVYGEFSVRSK